MLLSWEMAGRTFAIPCEIFAQGLADVRGKLKGEFWSQTNWLFQWHLHKIAEKFSYLLYIVTGNVSLLIYYRRLWQWFDCSFFLSSLTVLNSGRGLVSGTLTALKSQSGDTLPNPVCRLENLLMSFATYVVVCMERRRSRFTFQNVWKNGRSRTVSYRDIYDESRLRNQQDGVTLLCQMTRGKENRN